MRIPSCLLTRYAPFFGRFGIRHVGAVDTQNTAAVDGPLETSECPINILVIPYFDSYRHLADYRLVIKTL